mgnify:CR=1 FL=1|tara:strand:+ start:464 stop:1012 length:549 start_codon:yes stop_codon:yes gene_type:complete
MTKISAQKRKKNTELLQAFLRDIRQNKNATNKKKKKRKSRKKQKKLRGGAVSMDFETPDAQNVSTNGAMNQAISKQKMNANNMVNLNKALAGGGSPAKLSVPQMSQAGGEGNTLIKSMIDLQLQTRAQSEGDAGAMVANPQGVAGMAGGRKSRKKRRKRRKKRKTKKRTKRRRRRKSRRRKK